MMHFYVALKRIVAKECHTILQSRFALSLVTWIPLLGIFLLINIFSNGVIRDLSIGVVDQDHSKLSRMISAQLDASPTLKVENYLLSEAKARFKSGDIYAIVLIKKDFQKEVSLKEQPSLVAMINTQYILVGKIVDAALNATLMQSAGGIEFVKNLINNERASLAKSSVTPIGLQLIPLFNSYKNYFPFLVGAMLPALWQVFIVISVIVSMGSMFKANEQGRWLDEADGSILALILGKMLPYLLIFLLHGLFFLTLIYLFMSWSFEGSFAFMVLTQLLTILAYEAAALTFFVVGFDYARSLSLGAVYTAPAFAFMGVTFPVSDMPTFAQFWHHMLPISYYQKIQIAQANYGASLFDMMPLLGMLVLFLLPLPLIYYRFKTVLERE